MARFYETGRLYPFRDAQKGFHTSEILQMVYDAWADAAPSQRTDEWDFYCDVRDGFALGTNKAIRLKNKQQDGPINEPRYVTALK